MNDKSTDEVSQWYSTYGLITAERILSTYKLVLPQSDLLSTFKNPKSFYNHLLHVPLKNVLNGIILQQATDYQVYAQKLFVDYLLSEESGKGPESQGASTRESLEEERNKLITLNNEFQRIEYAQNSFIANSQATLINLTAEWKKLLSSKSKALLATLKKKKPELSQELIQKGLNQVFVQCEIDASLLKKTDYVLVDKMNEVIQISLEPEIKEQVMHHFSNLIEFVLKFDEEMSTYVQQVKELTEQIQSFRTQFYETILRIIEHLKLLPEYRMDLVQDAMNKESLYFDKTIGDRK